MHNSQLFHEKHENPMFFRWDAQLVRRFSKCSNFTKMKVSDQESSIFKASEDILRSKTGPFESKSKGIVYKFERKPWFFGTSNLRGGPYPVLPCQPRE